MSTTRELHEEAMDVYERALLAAKRKNQVLTKKLLADALHLESEAADSVSDHFQLEPTRSILHRSAATIALKAGNIEIARKYAERGLKGKPPADVANELSTLIEQIITLEAATVDYRRRAPRQRTRIQEIIRKHTSDAPVDIIALATELGISVRQAALGPNRSGEIFPDAFRGGSSGFSIRVNSEHPITRKRFTIAHETAHFLRHRERIGNRLVDEVMYRQVGGQLVETDAYKSRLGSTVEKEADRLAAQLLMPNRLLEQFRREGLTPEQMAERLKVSVQAIRIRLGMRT